MPCGAEAAKAQFAKIYPTLVAVMGEPFEFASEGLTWQWDTSRTRSLHGWDPKTNTVFILDSGDPSANFVTNNGVDCPGMYALYIRETAHMFYTFKHADPNFEAGWIEQGLVDAALILSGAEGAAGQSFAFDIIQNEGKDRVNGVRIFGQKYGDAIGSHGRSPVEVSTGQALVMLLQVLSGASNNDLLRGIDAELLARAKAAGRVHVTMQDFAQIVTGAAHGRTFDGVAPGAWLLAQPFTNIEGAAGRYLAVNPLNGGSYLVSAFQRTVDSTGGRTETPLADLDVKLSLVDGKSAVRANTTVRIPPPGDVFVDIAGKLGQGLPSGAYLVRAEATAGGQQLSATNVVLLPAIGSAAGSLVIIPLNADGTALRPDLVPQSQVIRGGPGLPPDSARPFDPSRLQVSGAEIRPTDHTGVLVLYAPAGTDVTISLGKFREVISSPAWQRWLPLRVPAS